MGQHDVVQSGDLPGPSVCVLDRDVTQQFTRLQVCVYFKHHSQKDPLLVRTMVLICLPFDSARVIAECACIYLVSRCTSLF